MRMSSRLPRICLRRPKNSERYCCSSSTFLASASIELLAEIGDRDLLALDLGRGAVEHRAHRLELGRGLGEQAGQPVDLCRRDLQLGRLRLALLLERVSSGLRGLEGVLGLPELARGGLRLGLAAAQGRVQLRQLLLEILDLGVALVLHGLELARELLAVLLQRLDRGAQLVRLGLERGRRLGLGLELVGRRIDLLLQVLQRLVALGLRVVHARELVLHLADQRLDLIEAGGARCRGRSARGTLSAFRVEGDAGRGWRGRGRAGVAGA